jgi:hypothetical protein
VIFPVLSKSCNWQLLPPFTEIQVASKTELQDAAPLYISITSFFLRLFTDLPPSVSALSPSRHLPNTDPPLGPIRKCPSSSCGGEKCHTRFGNILSFILSIRSYLSKLHFCIYHYEVTSISSLDISFILFPLVTFRCLNLWLNFF